MKTLVRKDIQLMGFNNILIIMLGTLYGFMIILSNEADLTQSGSLLSGILLISIPLSSIIREERKTKDIVLKSLPIDISNIVLSRYITIFIYILFIFGITFLSSFIFSFSYDIPVIGKMISISDLLFNIIIIMIFISIILPFQYLKRKTSSIINIIIYFILIIIPIIISKTNSNITMEKIFKYIGNIRFIVNPIIFILLGIGIYFLSFQISTKIYKIYKYIER